MYLNGAFFKIEQYFFFGNYHFTLGLNGKVEKEIVFWVTSVPPRFSVVPFYNGRLFVELKYFDGSIFYCIA